MSFGQSGRGLRTAEQELSTELSTGFVDKVDFLSKEKSLVANVRARVRRFLTVPRFDPGYDHDKLANRCAIA